MCDRVTRLWAVVVLLGSTSRAQVTQRVSVTSTGAQVPDGRDSVVPGGCPASSTFNATQTGRVDWSL
jgi:hypothetical protein